VGNALKWFPDRRGLATGLTAAGFGAGAAVTVIPIANMIPRSGYEHTFLFFGLFQGICIFLLGLLLIRPKPAVNILFSKRVMASRIDYTPGQMVKAPVFWVLYVMFVLVAAGGIIAAAQLGPIAKAYGLTHLSMVMMGVSLPLLTMTLSIDNLLNGLTRPLCGFLSDRIGRENTMFLIFVGEGLALLGMMEYGQNPYAFMFCAAMIFLCWGEIFSIFPAICADLFGSKYAAANAGTLYTAKGTAALLVPLASLLTVDGSWDTVFVLAGAAAILAGLAAKFILVPLRHDWITNTASHQSQPDAAQLEGVVHLDARRLNALA